MMDKNVKASKDESTEKSEVVHSDWPSPRRFFDWLGWPAFGDRFESFGFFDEHMLRTEEVETDDAYVVRAEMPGLDPDKDVDVHVSDHTLHIEATRKEEKEVDEKGRYRTEFRYGHFVRRLTLPAGVGRDDVKATYKDGILEVRLPLDREHKAVTQVPIQHV
jgi:HSP20 family protein